MLKKILIAVLLALAFLCWGLAGADEMQHDQRMIERHPEWAQFYED